jgi:hypothetical protein
MLPLGIGFWETIMNLSFKRAFAIFALIGLTACAPGNMFDGEGSGEVIAPETPLVVADGEYPTRMNQVSVGQPHLTSAQLPAVFETVDAEPNCRMPRPSRDAKLAYVYTYGGGVKTPLHYIADGADAEQIAARMAFTKEVAKQVAREGGFVEGAVARQFASFAKGNSVEWATRVDVLVTETEAPVFLVLTSYNAILWNIQLAPGAQIDGIVVSAYEGGAIANGASAPRTGFMGFDGSPNRSCRLDGRGKPVPTEVRIAGAKDLNPDFDPRGYKERWDAEYRDAQKFFSVDLRQKIGKSPTWLLNDARGNSFQAVLVGPTPNEPFVQQPVTRLQVPSYVAPYWGTRKGAFKYFGLDS